jgi:hypothetical protein
VDQTLSRGTNLNLIEKPRSNTQVLNDWVTNIEQLLDPAADTMPEAKYSLHPARVNSKGCTFADQVKHLAAANYQLGSRILGEPPPEGTQGDKVRESVKSKAEIVEYLKGSFVCLHRAATKVDEKE